MMNDNEECNCLKGKNCCKCGILLEGDDLNPKEDPFSADVWNEHSEHLLCYECAVKSAEEV